MVWCTNTAEECEYVHGCAPPQHNWDHKRLTHEKCESSEGRHVKQHIAIIHAAPGQWQPPRPHHHDSDSSRVPGPGGQTGRFHQGFQDPRQNRFQDLQQVQSGSRTHRTDSDRELPGPQWTAQVPGPATTDAHIQTYTHRRIHTCQHIRNNTYTNTHIH